MAWIESHTNLIRHKKVIVTAQKLRIAPVYLIGHLHVLWHGTFEMAEDGDLSGLAPQMIADAAAYKGNAEMFVTTLIECGWIEKNMLVHDWLDYAGMFLRRKYSTSNHAKLVAIWSKHGRDYNSAGGGGSGGGKATSKRPPSDTLATGKRPLPTNQPNQPTNRHAEYVPMTEAEVSRAIYGY